MGLTQQDMAKKLGFSTRTVVAWEKGENVPHLRNLGDISQKMEVSPEYFTATAYPEVPEQVITTPIKLSDHRGPFWGTTKEAPVVSWAQAGTDWHDFQDLCNQMDERIPTDCKDPNCFWLQIEGDSMEPRYYHGDYIILTPNLQAQNGDLVMLKTVDGAVYFKIFHFVADGRRVRLTSYNESLYPPIEFGVENVHRIYPVYGAFRRIRGQMKNLKHK